MNGKEELIDSGVMYGHAWNLYLTAEASPERSYTDLEVRCEPGRARWKDRLLVLSEAERGGGTARPGSVDPDVSSATVPVFGSTRGKSILILHQPDGLGDFWDFTDEQYIRMAIGSIAFARQFDRKLLRFGAIITTRSVRTDYTLDHVASHFFAAQLTPAQVWGCFHAAHYFPRLSLDLIVSSVTSNTDRALHQEEPSDLLSETTFSVIHPVVFDSAVTFKRLYDAKLTVPLWWYLYRIAAIFVATAPSLRDRPEIRDRYDAIEWVDTDISTCGFTACCRGCDSSDGPHWQAPVIKGVDGTPVDASGFEFFAGDLPTDLAAVDATVLTRSEQADLFRLLDDFICYRVIENSDALDEGVTAGFDHAGFPTTPVVACDPFISFVPVPVGFFGTLRSVLEVSGAKAAFGLAAGGLFGEDGQPDEAVSIMSTDLIQSDRSEESILLSGLTHSWEIKDFLVLTAGLRGLGEAEKRRWVAEQLNQLSRLVAFWPSGSELIPSWPGVSWSLSNASFLHGLISSVLDYYRDENDAVCLDWWLRLSGFDVRLSTDA